jgi:hypothetical protein
MSRPMYQAVLEWHDESTGTTHVYWESGGSLLPALEATRDARFAPMVAGKAITMRSEVIRSPEHREQG